MDGINETSADCTTTTTSVGRYSLRSKQNNFSGNDDDDEQHRDNSSSSSSHSHSDNDDPPLSEYELLRLRKIKRNEARLAQLGLLVPAAAAATNNSNQRQPSTNNNGGGASALTTLFLSSPQSSNNNNETKKRQKQQQDDTTTTKPLLVPRRILPKRHCTTTSSQRSFHNNNGYTSDDESSIAASPILPKRILTLQPHQAVAVATVVDGSNSTSESSSKSSSSGVPSCPRRERRGRPRKEDYVYVCEEVCAHCGGEWRLDGGEVEEEEEVDTRLIRCKDCRGAFHLDCMMLHGKTETEADGEEIRNDEALSCKENNSASASALLQNDKQDPVKVDDANSVIPKRCFQCECNKSKPKRKASIPALEAIIVGKKKKKMVTVRIILPELLPLEAVVCGKNVMCYVTLENS